MQHITQKRKLQAYQIVIAERNAVLFYAGNEEVVVEDLKLPAPFTVIHCYTPSDFSYCNWISDYIDLIYNDTRVKENVTLRKLLYCLEDECHFLCDSTTLKDYVVGLVYPEDLDLSGNRLDFGFCEEEAFFGLFSDFVLPYSTLLDHPTESIVREWNKGNDK